MRINKFLALAGFGSRRKCEELVKAGRVLVDGKKIVSLAENVDTEKNNVLVDGEPALVKHFDYIMMHKPKGFITSKSDEKERKTVMSLLPKNLQHLFPVGRLDFDTEGLLLFTNDGDFSFALTHPSKEMPKTYRVKVEGEMKESELAVLRAGVVIDGKRTGKAKVEVVEKLSKMTVLEMVIFEGRNRQIRKMFDAIGKNVVFLKRMAIGPLKLGGVARGDFRFLSEDEVENLLNFTYQGEQI